MPARSLSDSEPPSAHPDDSTPAISICKTCPGTVVFLETDNTDGWIATDSATELRR